LISRYRPSAYLSAASKTESAARWICAKVAAK
jgi:hypothetical protein